MLILEHHLKQGVRILDKNNEKTLDLIFLYIDPYNSKVRVRVNDKDDEGNEIFKDYVISNKENKVYNDLSLRIKEIINNKKVKIGYSAPPEIQIQRYDYSDKDNPVLLTKKGPI